MIDRKAAACLLSCNISCQMKMSASDSYPPARKPEIFKTSQLREPFSLRLFGLSRTIYVNYIHISCMISTITLIITAVMRATQMAMRGAEKTSIAWGKCSPTASPLCFIGIRDFLERDVIRFTSQRLKGFSWKWFALLGRLKMKHYRFLIHPLCSRSEYIPGRRLQLCRFQFKVFNLRYIANEFNYTAHQKRAIISRLNIF